MYIKRIDFKYQTNCCLMKQYKGFYDTCLNESVMILLHVCVSCEINHVLQQREVDLTLVVLFVFLLFSFVSDALLLAALLMSSDCVKLREADAADSIHWTFT